MTNHTCADRIQSAVDRGLITPDEGAMLHRIEADDSPQSIAEAVLDYHAIAPHWPRDRAQMAALIVEAVNLVRAFDGRADDELSEDENRYPHGMSNDMDVR